MIALYNYVVTIFYELMYMQINVNTQKVLRPGFLGRFVKSQKVVFILDTVSFAIHILSSVLN